MPIAVNPEYSLTLKTLRERLPPARRRLLELVCQEAESLGLSLYIVGGFVRDWFLGHPGLDFDLVVEGSALRLARHLAHKYGGRVREHRPFLTAKWFLPKPTWSAWQHALQVEDPTLLTGLPPFLDFITARKETYPYPGALPRVQPADIHADLARRDFSINAMALALTGPQAGTLLDPFHGQGDLRAGVLRPLHPRSFIEDPTRIPRGARYAARYTFTLAEEARQQIPQALPVLSAVSGDRWRHEFDLIFQEQKAGQALTHLREWGVLSSLHPQLPGDLAALQRVNRWRPPEPGWDLPATLARLPLQVPVRYALWWLELSESALHVLQEWLHFPSEVWEVVRVAARLWQTRNTWQHLSPGSFTLTLERAPLPAVYAVYLAASGPLREKLRAFWASWHPVPAPLSGHDLLALGIPPGPHYRVLLEGARVKRIEGRLPDREAALAWAREAWRSGQFSQKGKEH